MNEENSQAFSTGTDGIKTRQIWGQRKNLSKIQAAKIDLLFLNCMPAQLVESRALRWKPGRVQWQGFPLHGSTSQLPSLPSLRKQLTTPHEHSSFLHFPTPTDFHRLHGEHLTESGNADCAAEKQVEPETVGTASCHFPAHNWPCSPNCPPTVPFHLGPTLPDSE